tara:strand:+ start:385 stop:603 length:219 start_codon:yes stop_codon:yes gene_type:complete
MKNKNGNKSFDVNKVSRRKFLSILGLSAGASAAISSVSYSSDEESEELSADTNKKTYRETEHIKTVYNLSRF